MKVIILEDTEQVARYGAEICGRLLELKPGSVLGLATGSTPIHLYQQLIKKYQSGAISFKATTTFNLDEYLGLAPDHAQSYRYFMDNTLFNHIDIEKANTYLPDGLLEPETASQQYEESIVAKGGIDLQILGIGSNGHIGFNEPFSSFGSKTRAKTLTKQTIEDNRRFFSEGEVQPQLALTMGIGTILQSRQILLLATGEAKAAAVKAMVEGAVAAYCPASALQLHSQTTVLLDEAAAGQLEHADYYRWVQMQAEKLAAGTIPSVSNVSEVQ